MTGHRIRTRMIRMTLALAAMLVWSMCIATPAIARSFKMTNVNIDAALDAAGTLSVFESREFDFDGSFNGVYWNIPTGEYNGRRIVTTINEVGEIENGVFQAYAESSSGANHTYEVSDHGTYVQVKVYTKHVDERAQVAISYSDTNLATRYDDTGELYWKFVSDGWDVESNNIRCTIHLPVPENTVVTLGENVRAWGHGPLDASVDLSGQDIVYQVPGVGTSEFAEARIVFPAEWLSDVAPTGTSALSAIRAEEEAWAQAANERRERARSLIAVASVGGCVLGFGMPILAILIAIKRKRAYKVAHTPSFTQDYFRDVPSDDHPAVLGALYRGGTVEGSDLTASLMRLTDMGVIKLEPVTYTKHGLFGREVQHDDYRLVAVENAPIEGSGGSFAHDIDVKSVDLIFKKLVGLARHKDGQPDDGSFCFSEMEDIAKHKPERYHDAYENWTARVEAVATSRKFFIDDHKVGRGPTIAMGVVSILAGILAFVALIVAEQYLLAVLSGVAAIAGGVVSFILAAGMDPLSSEAVELKAKLEGLERWFKDFTRLGEAVPTDVVLWNRLLVMATALGVAKEVIKQLKVAAPQVLEDYRMAPIYSWYYYDLGRYHSPANTFNSALSSAHQVSTAALASSSNSSGSGSGGGFSGGGGGGFGGGGGGGAF